jgi:putative ABC transport system permease protein
VLWNALLLALREIRRNLLRSALTTLGIVIGVAAVIIMVTIGRGATAQVAAQIASLGTNLVLVRPGQRLAPGQRSAAKPFEIEDADAIGREVGGIAGVAPSAAQGMVAIAGNESWSTSVTGITSEYLAVRNWRLGDGRPFNDGELRRGAAVCILGETVRRELFGYQDPLGAKVRLKKLSCQVVGVLEAKGQSAMGSDQDDLILVPLRTFWRRVAGKQEVSFIQVSAREDTPTETVQRDIERLLRERRHISRGEDDDFSVMDMKEITRTLTGTTQVMTALLGAVAAVSLLVGGIGIMNIMLVSVTERTREIGTRLAIGALEREVLTQFLVEAVVLSGFGGLVGVVVALAAAASMAGLLQVPFIFDGGVVVLALAFAAAVGIGFGYFPARKAARMDPIEALRHE